MISKLIIVFISQLLITEINGQLSRSQARPENFESLQDYQAYSRQKNALRKAIQSYKGRQEPGSVTPDSLFQNCCVRQSKVKPGCYPYCNYANFDQTALAHMALKPTRDCPKEALGPYLYCAAAGMNHRANCIQNMVNKTSAGDKCLDLCDIRDKNVLQISNSLAPCLNVLPLVRKSFRDFMMSII